MTTISATVIADSIGDHSPRLTTLLLRYPRWIHAEGRTHRVTRIGEDMEIEVRTPSPMEDPDFSRNASSSRAIPVQRLIADLLDDPAEPLFWGANQPGMQATAELMEDDLRHAKEAWCDGRMAAINTARRLHVAGAHKQLVNRVLEPHTHINVVWTGTQYSNFFALRRHADAEPHIKMLADAMFEAMATSTPNWLAPGDWHLPFVSVEDDNAVFRQFAGADQVDPATLKRMTDACIKLSVARCASTSYKTVDGLPMTLERAIALHDKLVAMVPLHASPCEHQAKVDAVREMTSLGPVWQRPNLGGNLGKGWVQYRKTLAGECQ